MVHCPLMILSLSLVKTTCEKYPISATLIAGNVHIFTSCVLCSMHIRNYVYGGVCTGLSLCVTVYSPVFCIGMLVTVIVL